MIAVAHADAVDVGVADGARHLDGACTARGLLHRTRDRLEIALRVEGDERGHALRHRARRDDADPLGGCFGRALRGRDDVLVVR